MMNQPQTEQPNDKPEHFRMAADGLPLALTAAAALAEPLPIPSEQEGTAAQITPKRGHPKPRS